MKKTLLIVSMLTGFGAFASNGVVINKSLLQDIKAPVIKLAPGDNCCTKNATRNNKIIYSVTICDFTTQSNNTVAYIGNCLEAEVQVNDWINKHADPTPAPLPPVIAPH